MFIALGMSGAAVAPPAAVGFDTARFPVLSFWFAALVQGLGVGVCLICLSLAPRLATGPEVGITMLLQLLLSPLWVWLAFGETLPVWTIVGGLMIFATLLGHELALYRWGRAARADADAPPGAAARTSHGTAVEVVDVAVEGARLRRYEMLNHGVYAAPPVARLEPQRQA